MRMWTFKELSKFSYITKTELVGNICFVYYTINGKERFRKFPLRTSVTQLQKILTEIQKETGVNLYGKSKVGECYVI